MNASDSGSDPQANRQRGFTLIEILVSLILGSIMGALLVQFMGTSVIRSAKPIIRIQQHLSLNQAMENITSDYKKLLAEHSTPLATLKGYIDDGNDDNNTPYYGSYTPVTEYILFNGGSEGPGDGTNLLLKVTLTSGDQSLVTVFTR